MHSLVSGGISSSPAVPNRTSFTMSEKSIAPGNASAVSGVRHSNSAGPHCGSSGEIGLCRTSPRSSSPNAELMQPCSVEGSWSNRSPHRMAVEPMSIGLGTGCEDVSGCVGNGVVVGLSVVVDGWGVGEAVASVGT